MISIKQAVSQAVIALKDLYSDNEIADILLEEVELSEDNKNWIITLSFLRPEMELLTKERVYKSIKVNADNGGLVSLKIRVP